MGSRRSFPWWGASAHDTHKGAFRSPDVARHLDNIEKRLLPSITVLPYEVAAARVYGEIRAHLERAGRSLADADLQVVATALRHELELVTGNVRHFSRVPGLQISDVLASARCACRKRTRGSWKELACERSGVAFSGHEHPSDLRWCGRVGCRVAPRLRACCGVAHSHA